MRTIEQNRLERQRLEEERAEIIEASTASRLEMIRERLVELGHEEGEIRRETSRSVGPPSDEENELTAKIVELKHQERSVFLDARIVPDRFIRADSMKHHEKRIKVDAAELEKLINGYTGSAQPGPRIVARMNELQQSIDQWESDKKLCRTGEKIQALREECERLSARRNELAQQRQQVAGAV